MASGFAYRAFMRGVRIPVRARLFALAVPAPTSTGIFNACLTPPGSPGRVLDLAAAVSASAVPPAGSLPHSYDPEPRLSRAAAPGEASAPRP